MEQEEKKIPWKIYDLDSKHPDHLLEIPKDSEGYYLDIAGNRVAFNGNRELKPAYCQLPLNQYHLEEIFKASTDLHYFIFNYCKVLTKKGWATPELRDYQEEFLINSLTDKRLGLLAPRQVGKTVSSSLKFIWAMNFTQDTSIGICANIEKGANEVLHKMKQTFNKLPIWLQQGIVKWNVKSIYMENGSKAITSATNGDAFRGFSFVGGVDELNDGMSHSTLYVDECAFIEKWSEFADSVLPTVSSDPNANIILTSTPNGMNHWYDIVKRGRERVSEFKIHEVPWNCLPERNEEWREKIIATNGMKYFQQNYGCVAGDSMLTVEGLGDITIRDLYDSVEGRNDTLRLFTTPSRILTPTGYQLFDGVRKLSKPTLIFSLDDGSTIQVSEDHRFVVGETNVIASDLQVGDVLDTRTGLSPIISVTPGGVIDVYDPLEVRGGHSYYANDIVHHNCEFLGSSSTLLESNTLQKLQSRTPLDESTQTFTMYQKPRKDMRYILLCDIASGTGGDYTVAHVIKIRSNSFEQVAVFRSNTTPVLSLPAIFIQIAKQYNNAYMFFETNYGVEVPSRIYNDYEYENLLTVSKKGTEQVLMGFNGSFQLGLHVGPKTKSVQLISLKALLESGKVTLSDHTTVVEFYNFIQYPNGTFAAEQGKHDDTVMSLALLGWLVTQDSFKEIVTYDFVSDYETMKAEEASDLLPPSFFCDNPDFDETEELADWTV